MIKSQETEGDKVYRVLKKLVNTRTSDISEARMRFQENIHKYDLRPAVLKSQDDALKCRALAGYEAESERTKMFRATVVIEGDVDNAEKFSHRDELKFEGMVHEGEELKYKEVDVATVTWTRRDEYGALIIEMAGKEYTKV